MILRQTAARHVVLEASGAAHHWARTLQRLGHDVTLLHPGDGVFCYAVILN